MVADYQKLKQHPVAAADCLLALQGISNPTRQQRIGAMIDAEFKLRVISFLSGQKE